MLLQLCFKFQQDILQQNSKRKMSRGTKILCLITLSLLALLLVILFSPTHVSKLNYQGQIINILRNEYGIPFIQAPSRKAFLYGFGWALAEDRPFQITFRKLVSQGRLSEFLGQKALPMDKFMREANINGWGERMGNRLKEQNVSEYLNFQAFTDGLNECMASLKTLPVDFHLAGIPWQNWTVNNLFKIYKLVQFSLSVTAFQQIFRSALLVNYTKQQVDIIFPTTKQNWAFDSKTVYNEVDIIQRLKTKNIKNKSQSFGRTQGELIENLKVIQSLNLMKNAQGSNSWAISGNYTQSGKPILASDPHLGNPIPSQWYQYQGCYNNSNKKYCFSLFGLPGAMFTLGKTDYLAFGATIIYADSIDFYKEKVQNNKYFVDGKWKELKVRNEVIKVKSGTRIQQVQLAVHQTHRGPLINYYLTQNGNFQIPSNLSMQWTGAYDDFQGFINQSYIIELATFQDMIHLSKTSVNKILNVNLIIITADGHIASQRYGISPLRKNPELANFVKDGTTTQNDWAEYLPLQDKLTVVDPECGYIVAANNKGAQSEYYNDLLRNEIYTARADRITELIQDRIRKGIKFNVEITKQMQADTVDSYCQRILPTIIKVLPESYIYLRQFNCDFTSHSTIAPIYQIFFSELHHRIKKGNFDKISLLSQHNNFQYLYNFVKNAQSNSQNRDILRTTWKKMLENSLLTFDDQGKQTVRWGQIHNDVMNHVPFGQHKLLSYLYNRVFEGRGNLHTVNVGKMGKVEFGNFAVTHRATNRAIFSFEGSSYWIVDSGADQRFFSRHYDDQWELFKENQYIEIKSRTPVTNTNKQL